VGSWLGLTQAQLSRIENGRAPEELTKLVRYAQILGIPGDLLWFALPDDKTARAAPRPGSPLVFAASIGSRTGRPFTIADTENTRGEPGILRVGDCERPPGSAADRRGEYQGRTWPRRRPGRLVVGQGEPQQVAGNAEDLCIPYELGEFFGCAAVFDPAELGLGQAEPATY